MPAPYASCFSCVLWRLFGVLLIFALAGCATRVSSDMTSTASVPGMRPIGARPVNPVVTTAPPSWQASAPQTVERPTDRRSIFCPENIRFPNFPQQYQRDLQNMACVLQERYGLSAGQVYPALMQARFNARALALMTPPPPSPHPQRAFPWWRYRNRFVKTDRLQNGIRFWQAHQEILQQVEQRYGVSPYILAGILNIETGFGTFQGNFGVMNANLTLALGLPARRRFFLYQAAETLKLAQRLGVPISSLQGSEAGAMGMSQFLASSYLQYGTIWNDPPGEGLPDLWHSVPDVLASTARFFRGHGWQPGQPVMVAAEAPADLVLQGFLTGRHPLNQLLAAGIRPQTPSSLPGETPVGLLRLDTEHGPQLYIAYPNFYAIMGYNPSVFYSATVWAYAHALQEQLAGG